MGSSQSVLQYLIYQMSRGAIPFILLFFGTFGALGNLVTFTSKQLRNNSCAFYLLCTTMFELLTVSFGLISRIADQFGSALQSESRVYCKIRYYLALTFPTIATFLLVMTAIDRRMSTSVDARTRAFSQLRVAHRLAPLVIAICMIACSHTLVFVDHQPSCIPQPGSYALFYSVFILAFASFLPNTLLLFFGSWTVRNVKRSRHRARSTIIFSAQQRRKQRTDTQFLIVSERHVHAADAVLSSAVSLRWSCHKRSSHSWLMSPVCLATPTMF